MEIAENNNLEINEQLDSSILKSSQTLSEYLDYLSDIKEHYIIIDSVRDTGCKENDIVSPFSVLGLAKEVDFRSSYIFVIHNGQIIYEKADIESQLISFEFETNFGKIIIKSCGGTDNALSSIIVSGIEKSQNQRGHNIIVINSDNGNIIDSVCYDRFNFGVFRDTKKFFRIHSVSYSLNKIYSQCQQLNNDYNKLTDCCFSMYRKDNETLIDARKRWFLNYPKKTGVFREWQLLLSEFLGIFHNLCKEAEVDYWVESGTLLGTIRHNGFIPWDDDIDVSMLYEDFLKLVEYFKLNKERYKNFKISFCSDGFVIFPSFYLEDDFTGGAFKIDIFLYTPFDENFDIEYIQEVHKDFIKNDLYKLVQNKSNFDKTLSLTDEILKEFRKKTMSSKKEDNTKLCRIPGFSFGVQKRNYVIKDVFPLKTAVYENIEVNIPCEYENVLKNRYGEWLSFPQIKYYVHFPNADEQYILKLKKIKEKLNCE